MPRLMLMPDIALMASEATPGESFILSPMRVTTPNPSNQLPRNSINSESNNKDCAREKRWDFEVMAADQLEQILKGTSHAKEKMNLLFSQVGYLRINLFYEVYARLQLAEKNRDFDKALQLMNEYIDTVAMPFILPRMQQSWLSRLSGKLPEATLSFQSWRSGYKSWFHPETQRLLGEKERSEGFNQLKQTFMTLYTLSFSCQNFPPVCGAEEREWL